VKGGSFFLMWVLIQVTRRRLRRTLLEKTSREGRQGAKLAKEEESVFDCGLSVLLSGKDWFAN